MACPFSNSPRILQARVGRSESMQQKIRRALLSVSDKTGLAALGAFLDAQGVEILSTGGSAARSNQRVAPALLRWPDQGPSGVMSP